MQQQRLNQRKKQKRNVKISSRVRDILHGYIMSDGYLNKHGILCVEQSRKQKTFVLWLEHQLKDLVSPSGIKKCCRTHSKTKRKSESLRFYTKAVLHGFHSMWYQPYTNDKGNLCYRKKLPMTLDCFFNPCFISVWFAGDGTKTIGSLGAKFEVTAWTVEERLRLKNLFFQKFGIKANIIKSGQSKKGTVQWALKIPAEEYPKFRALITQMDLIPTLFPYKLHPKLNKK